MSQEGPGIQARYVPGSWIAVASGGACLLIDAAPDAAVVRECLDVARRAGGVDDMFAAILAEGLRTVADFALAGWQDGQVRVLLRGQATVVVRPQVGAQETVRAAGAATWVDRLWPAPVFGVELLSTGGNLDGPSLSLWGGAVMASAVIIDMAATDSLSLPSEGQGTAATGQVRAPEGEAVPVAEVVVDAGADDDFASNQPGGTFAAKADQGAANGPDEVPAEDTAGFDHLFGATEREPLPASDPVDALTARVAVPVVVHAEPQPVPSEPVTPAQPPPVEQEPGIISGLPWEASAPETAPVRVEPAAKAPGVSPVLAAHSLQPDQAATVNRAQLLEQVLAGPTVLAALCPAGHLSPAYASACRVCQLPMAAQQPFETPRPALGRLLFTTGDVVSLDRGVLMGRGPTVPDGTDADRPHVVQLGADGVDISREHLEVRLEGWHVQVCDLGSTNGTEVTLPGTSPQRLHPHEPATIEPGTVVTLAEVASFTYEVLE